MMHTHGKLSIIVMLVALASTQSLLADDAGNSPSEADGLTEQARACFRTGIALYDERDFNGAAVEFRRAYQLAKNFHILYNLGRVAVEQHDYASAIDLFHRYLDEGRDQVPANRRNELQQEISNLHLRIGHLKLLYEGPQAEVAIDDVVIGHTPLPAPIAVNVGRRRLSLRSTGHAPQVRLVDVPGQELVTIRISLAALADLPLAQPQRFEDPTTLHTTMAAGTHGPRHSIVPVWTATAVCAVGAVAAGIVAYQASQELSSLRRSYPITRDDLDSKQRTVHYASWTADGFLAGTALLAGIALYLTLDNRSEATETKKGASLAWSWPGVIHLEGHF
jgi:tetratricopeptide (TPR) repeat protein